VAQLKANQAAVNQAQANVNQAQVDLAHTVISAPIAGVVIARSVDVGQTVAASFQAPVLFVIANDLKHMQINASVDEADIGRVKTGQEVTFRVDAYPDRVFHGTVTQVRLQPTTVQNVVTYNTIIGVDNADGRIMPGMTATVSVIIRKSENPRRRCGSGRKGSRRATSPARPARREPRAAEPATQGRPRHRERTCRPAPVEARRRADSPEAVGRAAGAEATGAGGGPIPERHRTRPAARKPMAGARRSSSS